MATLHFDVALSTTGGGAGVEKRMWEVAELMGHMRKQCKETLRTVYTVQCGAEYMHVRVHMSPVQSFFMRRSCLMLRFLHRKELSLRSVFLHKKKLSPEQGAVSCLVCQFQAKEEVTRKYMSRELLIIQLYIQ